MPASLEKKQCGRKVENACINVQVLVCDYLKAGRQQPEVRARHLEPGVILGTSLKGEECKDGFIDVEGK